MWNCKTCGIEGEEHFYKSQKWYCKKCWNRRTADTQIEKIRKLKKDYGGKCTRCGYDKSFNALEFHHLDPTQKEFHLGNNRGLSEAKLRVELDKCILVCRNCHAELHEES